MQRVAAVRAVRLASKSAPTRKSADTPSWFHVENIPTSDYLIVPEVSSERRAFIPIGFVGANTLCSNLVKILPDATLYHFGILNSTMHMAWVRAVCGRLKRSEELTSELQSLMRISNAVFALKKQNKR